MTEKQKAAVCSLERLVGTLPGGAATVFGSTQTLCGEGLCPEGSTDLGTTLSAFGKATNTPGLLSPESFYGHIWDFKTPNVTPT